MSLNEIFLTDSRLNLHFHQSAQEINCVAGYLVDSRDSGEYLNSPYKYRDNDRREGKGEKGMKGERREP